MAVWLNFIELERHEAAAVPAHCTGSLRPDADAPDRARWPPGGILEPTSQCEQGRITTAMCGPRARKRTVAKAP